jgi:outer membrane protein OmpA-like peptidoglycan-associated protein
MEMRFSIRTHESDARSAPSCKKIWPSVVVALGLMAAAAATAVAEQAAGTKPAGNWQVPGEIQQPKGKWQVPGEIQKPGEIQTVSETCRTRLVVGADALFEFDKAELSPAAEASLAALGPRIQEIAGAAKRAPKTTVEGHTDAKGDDAYNDGLSERRARAVRSWLAAHGFLAAETPIVGHGERHPVAPNSRPDGSDDPEGRAKNRRVEVVLATCEP